MKLSSRLNLSALLSRLARPLHTPVAFAWPEQIPTEAQCTMDEYASHGEPLRVGGELARQTTGQTCGAMVLLVARSLGEPQLAQRVEREGIGVVEEELYRELRRAALGPLTWPRALGTPPWALAKAMGYAHTPIDTATERGKSALQWVYHATGMGIPVPLYTGGDLGSGPQRAIPRHVVLALPGGGLTPDGIPEILIYNPGTGYVYRVPIFAMAQRTTPLAAFGRWPHLVWAVLPTKGEV
ncbi:hypothetical protein J2S70_000371 [Trueperella bonasi]|uniref:Peptidase C39-like domain-containing protein n=1 Tax=Trueperella bonasi TaxID=312286 RepID=A0ABT9NEI3_9ACTO|nr:hypothetical protein [Trueperella bonasi]MDP9805789.1 hypothetical protein [Trueperella bonasi]